MPTAAAAAASFFIRERLYQTGGVITADSDLIEMSGLMGL